MTRLTPLALAVLALTGAAQAQTSEPQKLDRVEITGSLIKRLDRATPSVVQTITRDEIKSSGYASVDELLRANSSVDTSSISDGAASGFVSGLSTISLRGFGSQGTLILVNGRRLAPVGAVDINFGRGSLVSVNTIPKGAIDRVDILKDGASALYGSDAMAGVINYILRKDYQGIEANAAYSASDTGVGVQKSGGFTFGFGDMSSKGFNIFGGVEAARRDKVMHSELKDRGNLDLYNQYLNTSATATANGLSRFTPDSVASPIGSYYRVPPSLSGSTPLDGRNVANNSVFGVNYLGTYAGCAPENTVGVGVPTRPPGLATGPTAASFRNGQCRYNLDNADEAISAQDRVSAMLRGTVAIGDSMTGYFEAMYSKTETTETGPGRTLTTGLVSSINPVATTWPKLDGSFMRTNAIILPVGHPDNPTNEAIQVIHRFEDVPHDDISTLESTRLVAGIEGSVGAWDFDAALMLSQQDNERVQQGRLRKSLLESAIANRTYRFSAPNNAAGIASVASDAVNTGESKITSLDVRGSRGLFDMAGGEAAIAVGAEYRREQLASVPDDNYLSGDYIGLVANGASGKRNVWAAYSELSLPVLKSLETQAALRYEKYSDFGNSTTGKLGFKYSAIPSHLVFRGTAATGFRAPSISQISNSFVASFHSFQARTVYDPIRCDLSDPNNPISRGDPANSRDCNVLARTTVSPLPGNMPTVVAANPDLKPETSRSFTLGVLLSPNRFVDLAVDAWHFQRDDEIRVQRGVDIMDRYTADPVANGGPVVRDPNPQTWLPGVPNSGPIIMLIRGYGNFQWTKTSGIDYELNVRMPDTELGKLSLRLQGTYTKKYDQLILAGDTPQRLVGTDGVDIAKSKLNAQLNLKRENLSAWVRWNHQDGIERSTTATCLSSSSAGNRFLQANNGCAIGAENTYDLGLSYRGFKNLTIAGSVLNLTNAYDRSTNIPSSFTYWDAGTTAHLGRRFSVSVDYSF